MDAAGEAPPLPPGEEPPIPGRPPSRPPAPEEDHPYSPPAKALDEDEGFMANPVMAARSRRKVYLPQLATKDEDMKAIDRIHNHKGTLLKDTEGHYIVDPNVDALIKAKLIEWDKNADGTFTVEDCRDALAELREVQLRETDLRKKIVLAVSVFVVVFIVAVVGGLLAYNAWGRVWMVDKSSIVAQVNSTNRKATIVTAEVEKNSGLAEMLKFSDYTDDWAIAEEELRHIKSVTFKDSEGIFRYMQIAHIKRVDRGPTPSADDYIEITTVPGHLLKISEEMQEIEVKWYHSDRIPPLDEMWTMTSLQRRRLGDHGPDGEDLPGDMPGDTWQPPEASDEGVDFEADATKMTDEELLGTPPRGRRAKGTVVMMGGVGGSGYAGSVHGGHTTRSEGYCKDLGNGSYKCESSGRRASMAAVFGGLLLACVLL